MMDMQRQRGVEIGMCVDVSVRENGHAGAINHRCQHQRRKQHNPQPNQPAKQILPEIEPPLTDLPQGTAANPIAREGEKHHYRRIAQRSERVQHSLERVVLLHCVIAEEACADVARHHRQRCKQPHRVQQPVFRQIGGW